MKKKKNSSSALETINKIKKDSIDKVMTKILSCQSLHRKIEKAMKESLSLMTLSKEHQLERVLITRHSYKGGFLTMMMICFLKLDSKIKLIIEAFCKIIVV